MMKFINKTWIQLSFSLLLVLTFGACEDESTYEENPNTLNAAIGLTYENLTTYSYQTVIKSAQPQFNIDKSAYNFNILTVSLNGTPLVEGISIFTIDEKTGIISIDNRNGVLANGAIYEYTVGIGNVNGIIPNENAFALNVLDTPLGYSISNDTYDANYLENSDIATISYEDLSPGGDVLSDISYNLENSPVGFSIDAATGVISKNTNAASGVHKISVKIGSNLGPKTFEDVLTVTVGDAPVLSYVQSDQSTPLTNTVLSPWTSYKTANPLMEGMNAVAYEMILPAELVAGSVIVDAQGSIAVLADQNLPVGTHTLGVIATNASGISATFNNVFTLTVETRWETGDFFNDTFNDDSTGPVDPGNTLYPDFAGYTLGTTNNWNKAVVTKSGLPTIQGIRIQNPGTNHHYLVKTVDITGVKAMQVSFGEQWGYNDAFGSTYSRGFYAGDSTSDLEGGSFDPANWTTIMPFADPRWPGSSTWKERVPNTINNVAIDLSNINGSMLKLAWYIGGDNAQNGQYLIDYCNAQIATAFPAEES